ncbi:MAG: hypothetical protein KC613_23260 [Myxococcales bacterium]|nr:hypothetical protein [Myxococcales bacterium]MCB9525528.1 hypothetical protein [Myxococcales bacterium]
MTLRLFCLIAAALLWTSCGAEREHTGVWQQVCDEAAPSPCGDFVYELHLGRYGSKTSGLVVRYHFEDVSLDPYQRSDECGCFFVEGGRADDEGIAFALHRADEPGRPETDFRFPDACGPAGVPPPDCVGRRFELSEVDGELEGSSRCGSDTTPIRFRKVAGRPRRACELPE